MSKTFNMDILYTKNKQKPYFDSGQYYHRSLSNIHQEESMKSRKSLSNTSLYKDQSVTSLKQLSITTMRDILPPVEHREITSMTLTQTRSEEIPSLNKLKTDRRKSKMTSLHCLPSSSKTNDNLHIKRRSLFYKQQYQIQGITPHVNPSFESSQPSSKSIRNSIPSLCYVPKSYEENQFDENENKSKNKISSETKSLLQHSLQKIHKRERFNKEVEEIKQQILATKDLKQQIKKNCFSKGGSLFQCFSSLINLSVVNQGYNKYHSYQKCSPLIFQEAQNLLKYHSSVFEGSGSGLILIQTNNGCSIVPTLDNKIIDSQCYLHPVGMKFLVEEMKELLQYDLNGLELREGEVESICKEIILKHCYFAQNYSSEKLQFLQSYLGWIIFKKPLDHIKDSSRNFNDYVLNIHLGYQQIQCTEVIFTPTGKYRYLPTLVELIQESLSTYKREQLHKILKNIVCLGPYFQLKGFTERLKSVLVKEFPNEISPTVRLLQMQSSVD